ncbi:MAG: Ca2+-binding EF-hand superfamily protein [Phenylobacterium sp.]|jgi:Ca2+-binding EF-hand superfamily protein
MSSNLTDQQVKTLQQNFKTVDTDGNGKIDKQELHALFAKMFGDNDDLNIDQMVEAAFQNCDVDESGYITFDEYIKLVVAP